MTRLNDIIDLYADYQTELDNSLVEAYGLREAPCLSEEITINRATEYVIKYGGFNRRVYNWEQESGSSRMYIKVRYMKLFVTAEVEAMLTQGNPSYGALTPVAATVRVAA